MSVIKRFRESTPAQKAWIVGLLLVFLGSIAFIIWGPDGSKSSAARRNPAVPAVAPASSPTASGVDASGSPSSEPYPASPRDLRTLLELNFREDYVDNPFYQCPDHRNDHLTRRQVKQFVPCVNGSLRLRVKSGVITVQQATVKPDIRSRVKEGSTIPPAQPSGITVRTSVGQNPPERSDSGRLIQQPRYVQLAYDYGDNLQPFNTYIRKNGQGPWKLEINLNDQAYPLQGTYEVVFTWRDITRPATDAPVPFKWTEVRKDYNY